jgi:hypothetical protein
MSKKWIFKQKEIHIKFGSKEQRDFMKATSHPYNCIKSFTSNLVTFNAGCAYTKLEVESNCSGVDLVDYFVYYEGVVPTGDSLRKEEQQAPKLPYRCTKSFECKGLHTKYFYVGVDYTSYERGLCTPEQQQNFMRNANVPITDIPEPPKRMITQAEVESRFNYAWKCFMPFMSTLNRHYDRNRLYSDYEYQKLTAYEKSNFIHLSSETAREAAIRDMDDKAPYRRNEIGNLTIPMYEYKCTKAFDSMILGHCVLNRAYTAHEYKQLDIEEQKNFTRIRIQRGITRPTPMTEKVMYRAFIKFDSTELGTIHAGDPITNIEYEKLSYYEKLNCKPILQSAIQLPLQTAVVKREPDVMEELSWSRTGPADIGKALNMIFKGKRDYSKGFGGAYEKKVKATNTGSYPPGTGMYANNSPGWEGWD